VLVEIGKKHGKSRRGGCVGWRIVHGRIAIPKGKTESRIKQNFEGDCRLSAEDVKRIDDEMDKKLRFNDPSESFSWKFYSDLVGKSKPCQALNGKMSGSIV